jgi:large repetitive protein
VRSGNIVTITATTSSDAEKVTASILGETLKLKKQSTTTWMLRYAVPTAIDGLHNIPITATDKAGNQVQTTLNFTVDNTPPTLNPTIKQTLVKSGDKITITTTADTDTQSVKAYIHDNTYDLTKNPNDIWSLEYTTPTVGDGVYSILLMARDMVGNTNQTPLTFTVDNTPPVINPEINPESANPGETITITIHASPDTQSVVAIIGTQRINLILSNGTWTTNYTIPLDETFDIHTIQIEGTDMVGNVGKNIASYEVQDPNPNPGPGLNPRPGPGPEPSPGPNPEPEPTPNPLNTPHTQLQRDIAGVRQAVQQGSFQDEMNQSVIPDWKEDPSPPPTNEEYEGWLNTMLKFSVEVAILAFIEFTPTGGSATGEYLQGIKTTFLNNFKALNIITSYFNKMKNIEQISNALIKADKVINNPTVQTALKTWDSFLNKVGFNYGMSVFKKGLYKLFPNKKSEIDSLLLFSSWQFLNDPDGTINAIIDTITSLMKGKLPNRESFEKIFIFDPAQDK